MNDEKMKNIIQVIMEHANEYATKCTEEVIVGTEPVKKHKKKRIQKKWLKRYGVKPVYSQQTCKKVSVTTDLIIEVCEKYHLPLPEMMFNMEVSNE